MNTDPAVTSFQDVSVPDTKHRIRLKGVCSINGGPDNACTAIEVSLSSLTLETDVTVELFDKAIVNLPQLGLVEAIVTAISERSFELHFEPAPQSKLGILVTWIESAATSSEQIDREVRTFERIVPLKRLTTLYRNGEPPSMARIVDLSCSGVAVTTSKALAEGEHVLVGTYAGQVVRLIEGGAAIRFDRLIDEKTFDILIDLGTRAADVVSTGFG